jgi:hypothetical protein
MPRVPLLTTWYKGFREQNALKRLYNGVMVRGERVIAVSDQLAELIVERYRIASDASRSCRRASTSRASIRRRFRPSASRRSAAPGASRRRPRSSSWSAACSAARAIMWR